jgi:hypothetical protein
VSLVLRRLFELTSDRGRFFVRLSAVGVIMHNAKASTGHPSFCGEAGREIGYQIIKSAVAPKRKAAWRPTKSGLDTKIANIWVNFRSAEAADALCTSGSQTLIGNSRQGNSLESLKGSAHSQHDSDEWLNFSRARKSFYFILTAPTSIWFRFQEKAKRITFSVPRDKKIVVDAKRKNNVGKAIEFNSSKEEKKKERETKGTGITNSRAAHINEIFLSVSFEKCEIQ